MSNSRYSLEKDTVKAVLCANIFWPYIAKALANEASRIDIEVELCQKLGPDLGEAARLYLSDTIKWHCITGEIIGFNINSLANSAYKPLQAMRETALYSTEVEQCMLDVVRDMYPDLNVGIIRG